MLLFIWLFSMINMPEKSKMDIELKKPSFNKANERSGEKILFNNSEKYTMTSKFIEFQNIYFNTKS
jgi:hypothetical protein